jgi:aromatic-L-amino-acid/L-tryptophan decarboxylase
MNSSDFRTHGYALIDWIAEYLDHPERYPVLPRVAPGDVRAALPRQAPEQGEPFADIFSDFERVLVPALTHWNHPGFFAYFAISSVEPAILAELLSAALNQQAMLWRTSPAATELEAVTLDWLRQLLGLPDAFDGVIYDTASISTLHALAAARERLVPGVREHGLAGRTGLGQPRVYCSEQAHSSVDKAVMLLGLGHASLRRIACDNEFRMRADLLRAAIEQDIADGRRPIAVVATFGTTATTSVDPLAAIAAICREHGVWLHVDAAYAGVTAVIPELRSHADGWEQADSIVLNPHKWLFVPFDLSVLYCRHMDTMRAAFSLVPDILRTPEGDRGVKNLMDTGIQLGRRFRALKLWMVLRHLGADGVRALLKEHMRLAALFASWVDGSAQFERLAPVPFSVVCFRARPDGVAEEALDTFNERLVDAVNGTGELFLSHARVNGVVAIRLAIGNARTAEAHVARAWALLERHTAELATQV